MIKIICYDCKNMSCIYKHKDYYVVRCRICSSPINIDKEVIDFTCLDFEPSRNFIKANKKRLKEFKKIFKHNTYDDAIKEIKKRTKTK